MCLTKFQSWDLGNTKKHIQNNLDSYKLLTRKSFNKKSCHFSPKTQKLFFSYISHFSHRKSWKSLFALQTNNRSKQTFLHSDTVSWLHKERNRKFQHELKMLRHQVSLLKLWVYGETQMGVNRFQITKPNLTHNYMAWKASGRTQNTRIIYYCSPFYRSCPPLWSIPGTVH